MAEALRRIPRRIVVLLDEIDRMQAEELRVLLKIIRGVTSFPNLCYVCAFSRTAIERIYPKETTEGLEGYYEKFFPVSFILPKPEPDLLFRVLQAKLERVFNSLDWFDTEEDRTKFQKRMKDAWEDVLAKLFTNLRKITLAVNDVSVGAVPIAREVNAFDFFLIESLRRFFPEVYKQVWQNAEAFMETNLSWGSRLYSEERVKAARQEVLGRLIKELQATQQSRLAGDILWWMFPSFATQFRQGLGWQRKRLSDNPEVAEAEKRIFHEDFFPIYFRYQAPESLYSETELRKFATAMNSAGSLEDRKSLFKKTLSAIPKADPRRYSFMHRLLQSMGRLNDAAAEALSYAVAENASEYIYDSILPSVAEAGRGMLIVFTVAQRFANTSKVQEVLEKSILSATDDTFALRLLTFSTESGRNKILTDHSNVRPDGLRLSFIQRMRKRYVDEFKVLDTSLAQADRDAFVLWAQYSDEERNAEIGFWRRFVGNDRKRLARLCDTLFPRGVLWETNPRPHIEKLFPLSELEKLEKELTVDGSLEDAESKALARMRRLISGEFQNGVTHDDLRDF